MKLVIYNKTLDPNLWDENKHLDKEVKDALLKIAVDFYESTDFSGDIVDILMLGSSVNYNWTSKSDIDLHVVIDISKEKINTEYVRGFFDSLSSKWNLQHNIKIKGHKVEIYLQDLAEKNHSQAIYSIVNDKWMKPPVREEIVLDKEKIKKKYKQLSDKIKSVINTEDVEKLKNVMSNIRDYRQSGLDKYGEYSTENIVFKALRHTGMLKKLKDATNQIYDKKISIKESIYNNYDVWMDHPDRNEFKGDNYHIENIPISKITDVAWTVTKIRKNIEKMFREGKKLPLILIEKKENGIYALQDGQHRFAAYRNVFPKSKYIKSAVFTVVRDLTKSI